MTNQKLIVDQTKQSLIAMETKDIKDQSCLKTSTFESDSDSSTANVSTSCYIEESTSTDSDRRNVLNRVNIPSIPEFELSYDVSLLTPILEELDSEEKELSQACGTLQVQF